MKKIILSTLSILAVASLAFVSCEEDRGANPYDPSIPTGENQMPEISSFTPTEAEAGTIVTIHGINFSTATAVSFGTKPAESFNIIDDNTIEAVVSVYGASGVVAVTNHKGTENLAGFKFIKAEQPESNGNLAIGCDVYCSSTIAGNIFNLTDGDPTTFWQAGSADHEWIVINLGKIAKFNTIVMTMDPGACPTGYEILVSEDNETYTSVFKENGYDPSSDEGIHTVKLPEIVQGQYIKIDMTVCVNIWNYTFKEVEIYNKENSSDDEPETPINLAINCDVECSSTIAGNILNITNGDDTDFWQAGSADHEWFIIDFGKVVEFNTIVMTMDPGACPTTFEVLVSDDKETFTSVHKEENYVPSSDDGVHTSTFASMAQGRYMKVDMTVCVNIWYYTIKEVEVYKKTGGSESDPTVNVALDKDITCSSTIAGSINNVVDGDDTNFWQAGSADHEWFVIDLGQSYTVSKAVMTMDPGACPTTYEFLLSDDNETFTSVFKEEGYDPTSDEGYHVVTFTPATGRFIKVDMTVCVNIWNYTFKEFELY